MDTNISSDIASLETKMVIDIDDSIGGVFTDLEGDLKGDKKSIFPKYMSWKIPFFVGLILIIVFIIIFVYIRGILKRNIDDLIFFRIYDGVTILLIVNLILLDIIVI